MPNTGEQDALPVGEKGKTYGSILDSSGVFEFPSSASKKVIYCVHGKPSSGCCTVLEGEIIDIEGDILSTPTKKNANATKLVNKHCHKSQTNEVDTRARRKLIIASVLCVIFMIGEIIGGYLSNSLAIASDAAHLLTDFASFMISLFSLWIATRPSSKKMSFGWYRSEVLGALGSVLLIWVVTGILVYMAIERCIYKNFEVDAEIMMITSGIGVIVNLIMGFTLHQHSHKDAPHSHSHNNKTTNINVRAAFIHVVGDLLQSFGVFVAAVVVYFKRDWMIVDPICTFIFSILVMFTTFAIIKDTLTVLMEGSPKGIDFNEVMTILLNIEGVKKVHNLRIWALSLDKLAMSAHVAIMPRVNPQEVLMAATKDIQDKFNFFEMTLQIEEFEETMEDCFQCKNPV